MGVTTHDCDFCGGDSIHEDYCYNFVGCDHIMCIDCVLKKWDTLQFIKRDEPNKILFIKDIIHEEDEEERFYKIKSMNDYNDNIILCPHTGKHTGELQQKIDALEQTLNKLLDMYNKRRKNKITLKDII